MRPDAVASMLREAKALVFVDDLADPQLSAEDGHHLGAVLRLRSGELVAAGDGKGGIVACRAEATSPPRRSGGRDRVELHLRPCAEPVAVERVGGEVTVGFSLAKGARTDWAVSKLTELGVDRIVPLRCARTVVPSGDRRPGHLGRLRRLAREAAMQSRRPFLPEVTEVLTLSEAVGLLGDGLALAEPGGDALTGATGGLLVGPEGGFTAAELDLGLPLVGLGETILRIETAAVVAGALLVARRGGWLGEAVRPDW